MKRLTKRHDGHIYCPEIKGLELGGDYNFPPVQTVLFRLADYEDTKLTPQEIMRLQIRVTELENMLKTDAAP